jgi:hypothetical protein
MGEFLGFILIGFTAWLVTPFIASTGGAMLSRRANQTANDAEIDRNLRRAAAMIRFTNNEGEK